MREIEWGMVCFSVQVQSFSYLDEFSLFYVSVCSQDFFTPSEESLRAEGVKKNHLDDNAEK